MKMILKGYLVTHKELGSQHFQWSKFASHLILRGRERRNITIIPLQIETLSFLKITLRSKIRRQRCGTHVK
uniref:Uncharacterized protein n=1 Tax=Lepeophtheirus salmonis TaxID=72036 RepID=A0A0K2VIZ6_LEPSM